MTDVQTAALLTQLEEARRALLTLCDSLDDDAWQAPVFSDGDRWTVLDLVRHLTSAERSMTRLMEMIRHGGEGASPEFDLARWNASQVRKQQEKSPDALRADLSANREALLAFIAGLQPDEWERRGRHGSGRVMSLYEITRLIATHEQGHLADIRAALEARG